MKARIFRDLARLLAPSGIIVNLVSSPEIYTHEWASFTTEDFGTGANNDKPLAVLLKYEHFSAMQEMIRRGE